MTPVERAARFAGATTDLVARAVTRVQRLAGDAARDARAVARDAEALYGASASTIATARRATPRFWRIVSELGAVLAAERIHAARAGLLDADAAAAERDAVSARGAERVYNVCAELRGGVLKLGQFVSSRPDLLPAAYGTALARLQDRAPPVPFDAIQARVTEELGALVTLDPEPLATASLAQVHAGVLADGTEVAVKVQIPGIDELVEVDVAAVRALAAAIGRPDVDVFVRELGRALREELDYRLEAARLTRMRALDVGVRIPRVLGGTGRVLLLERLRGARLTDHLDAHPEDIDRLLGALAESYARQILDHGFFHADPHPGNFLVVDGALALLDFGCVGELADGERRAYAGLAGAILRRDAQRLAGLLDALGFRARDPAVLAELAASLLPADLSTFDPKIELARALAVLRERPEVPEHFVLLGRVLTALGGLVARYKPRVDVIALLVGRI